MTEPDRDMAGRARPEPSWLRNVATASSMLNRIAAAFAAILLVLMVGLILVEIVLRFFSRSTFMTDVLVGHGVAAITFLALGWTLEQGSMIRISAITQRLSKTPRFIAEAFAVASAGILVIWLMYFEWRAITKLWARGTTSEHYLPIPLWIPESFFFVGFGLLALQLLVLLLRLFVQGQDKEASLKL